LRDDRATGASLVTRVAVVIVNYNSGAYLGHCLDALERQSVIPHRAIIVDNASDDADCNLLQGRPAWMQLLPLQSNTGFARANNIAVSHLRGYDYLALLNPDTVPAPDWLEQLLAGAARHGATDCFGSCMLGYDDDAPADGTADVYHVSGLYWRRDHGRSVDAINTLEAEIFSPCAAAALYHFKSFTDVGGFDEDYFCYSEDIDLGFRLRARGCRAWYIPAAVVRHAGSATTGKHSAFTIYHGHRNLVWTFFKNMPGTRLWRYLPQHLWLNLVSIVVFTMRGHAGTILRAKRDALLGLPRALSKRKLERQMRLVEADQLVAVMRRGLLAPYRKRHE
jgi:GT2 family glycosyltransferase